MHSDGEEEGPDPVRCDIELSIGKNDTVTHIDGHAHSAGHVIADGIRYRSPRIVDRRVYCPHRSPVGGRVVHLERARGVSKGRVKDVPNTDVTADRTGIVRLNEELEGSTPGEGAAVGNERPVRGQESLFDEDKGVHGVDRKFGGLV